MLLETASTCHLRLQKQISPEARTRKAALARGASRTSQEIGWRELCSHQFSSQLLKLWLLTVHFPASLLQSLAYLREEI